MLIVSEETKDYNVLSYIPRRIRKYLYNFGGNEFEEIRLRRNMPVTITKSDGRFVLSKKGDLVRSAVNAVVCDNKDMDEAIMLISENSFYSVCDKMIKGYITLMGGHRVGVAGSYSVGVDNKSSISDISGLNFRIAKDLHGVSDSVIDRVYSFGRVKNTLIISPPGYGKTTLLRDLVRNLSKRGIGISVIDERHELFAMHNGIPSFDTGIFVDVIDNCTKKEGMEIALRTLSPQVIVTDEIGSDEEDIIKYILKCGVCVIATAHGDKFSEKNELLGLFENIIYINKKHNVCFEDDES